MADLKTIRTGTLGRTPFMHQAITVVRISRFRNWEIYTNRNIQSDALPCIECRQSILIAASANQRHVTWAKHSGLARTTLYLDVSRLKNKVHRRRLEHLSSDTRRFRSSDLICWTFVLPKNVHGVVKRPGSFHPKRRVVRSFFLSPK